MHKRESDAADKVNNSIVIYNFQVLCFSLSASTDTNQYLFILRRTDGANCVVLLYIVRAVSEAHSSSVLQTSVWISLNGLELFEWFLVAASPTGLFPLVFSFSSY